MQLYYVDSCIYLNLWQKEVAFDGFKFWKVAKHFLEMVEDKKETIYYSGFLIREIKFILTKEEFKLRRKTFDSSPNFIKLNLSEEEFEEARRIEKLINYKIGFYDIIHLILTRRTRSILITRDRNLIEVAKKFNVRVARPEEILNTH